MSSKDWKNAVVVTGGGSDNDPKKNLTFAYDSDQFLIVSVNESSTKNDVVFLQIPESRGEEREAMFKALQQDLSSSGVTFTVTHAAHFILEVHKGKGHQFNQLADYLDGPTDLVTGTQVRCLAQGKVAANGDAKLHSKIIEIYGRTRAPETLTSNAVFRGFMTGHFDASDVVAVNNLASHSAGEDAGHAGKQQTPQSDNPLVTRVRIGREP